MSPHSMFEKDRSRSDVYSESAAAREWSSEATSPDQMTLDNDNGEDGKGSKRTPKACDRCRHKKTKCTGESPCQRCRLDNTVCSYTNRRPKEGPNFNPQVAQKDAAMSILYKCIEVMNKQLLSAKFGPYSNPEVCTEAESEDFIIGVILDRFGINPVLDEYDNQPVYLPGQKGYVPGASSVEFPVYSPLWGSTVSYPSILHSQRPTHQLLHPLQQQQQQQQLNTYSTLMDPGERQVMILTPNSTTPAIPELERNSEYASSPETTPQTPPLSHPVAMELDKTFDLTSIPSCITSPPPPILLHSEFYPHASSGRDSKYIACPTDLFVHDSSSTSHGQPPFNIDNPQQQQILQGQFWIQESQKTPDSLSLPERPVGHSSYSISHRASIEHRAQSLSPVRRNRSAAKPSQKTLSSQDTSKRFTPIPYSGVHQNPEAASAAATIPQTNAQTQDPWGFLTQDSTAGAGLNNEFLYEPLYKRDFAF